MDRRRILHVGGRIQPALLMMAVASLLASEKALGIDRGMLIIDHRDVPERPKPPLMDDIILEFSKMKVDSYEGSYIGSKCRICGRGCLGKDKFCSKNHELMWKRRGR